MKLSITLPWPPSGLSPNANPHWAERARLKKQYRQACAYTARAHGVMPVKAERLNVHLIFVPPSRHRRDWDNMVASMKAGLDGLADALKVDDSIFRLTFDVAEGEIGGFVRVEVTE